MGKGIPIRVLGTGFTIQTDESPEYVAKLVDYVSGKIRDLEQSVATKDSVRLAVLASILIADELFKERQNRTNAPAGATLEDTMLSEMTKNIIARLDAALDGQAGSNS